MYLISSSTGVRHKVDAAPPVNDAVLRMWNGTEKPVTVCGRALTPVNFYEETEAGPRRYRCSDCFHGEASSDTTITDGIAAIYPYRATLPKGSVPVASTAAFRAANTAAGGQLALTEAAGDASVVWVWARTAAAVEAAERHLEKLSPIAMFARHDGTGQR
jgi:hypothetical protein